MPPNESPDGPVTAPPLHAETDGFKETPTAQPLMSAQEAVLARLLHIQAELAELSERQTALLQSAKAIESSVAQAFLELKQVHSDELIANAGNELVSSPTNELHKTEKTAVISRVNAAVVDVAPEIDIPGDDDWNRWKAAWDDAKRRASHLSLPRLPSCPLTRAALDEFLRASFVRNDDVPLREFFARFGQYLDEYERTVINSKLFTASQSLDTALQNARTLDVKTDAQIERVQQALTAWREKMNAHHRWFADDCFDAELTETLTVAYDCLALQQIAQPQLASESMRHACDWLLYFLTLLGVHKDSGLQIGVLHEQLPSHLRDKFPVQSLKPGRSADACRIASIVRNRWYRIAENREIQVVRPWYELA